MSLLCTSCSSVIVADRLGSGHHNIVLTPDEKKVFGQLFQAADSEKLNVVTGELAVKFFEKSGLNPRILGEVSDGCQPPHSCNVETDID